MPINLNTEEDINKAINDFEQELKKLPGGLGSSLVKSERALLLTFAKFLIYKGHTD